MAAYPSYADYVDMDGDGESVRRRKRAPNVPLPGPAPTTTNIDGPPNPYSPNVPSAPPSMPGPSAVTTKGRIPLDNPMYGPVPKLMEDPASLPGPPQPGPLPPGPPINPHVGEPTSGLNKTGKQLAEIKAMRDADVASKIHKTDWGYEVDAPEQSPSRFRQALMGALQGALAGAERTGTLGGLLGGAGTGAAAGGISPRMMLALKRDQDIRRAQGQLSDDLSILGQKAKVEEVEASGDYQRARPDIEMAEVLRKRQEDVDTLEQRRQEEYGRMSREEMQDARSKLGNQTTIEAAKIRAGSSGGSGAIAREGEEEAAQADAAIPGVQAVIDKWSADNAADEVWIKNLETEWNAKASELYKQAVADYDPDFDAKPDMNAILDQVRRADSHYPDYERTKTHIIQRTSDIEKERAKLKDIEKERRGGKGKAARGTGTKQAKQPSSDGKYHYTLAEVQAAAGDNWQNVLKQLQSRQDVVIDQ